VGPIENTPVEDWDRTQNIVLRSVFLGMKHATPHLKARGKGAIVSTASMAGLRGVPGVHAYCAAKAGVINLTRSAAVELARFNVTVNCICPGDILTPLRSSNLGPEEMERDLASHQPIARAGKAEDIAGAALYFASDDAAWVTGTALEVDGGATVGIWKYGLNEDLKNLQNAKFLEASYVRMKLEAERAKS
jgi:NAD(P)-dependent dehydrogenase (short-subunit alcohol dehydrogenase family)